MPNNENREYFSAGVDGAYLAGSSTADVASFYIPERCTVTEIGIVPTVNAGSNNTIVDFDRRILTGSDTGRGVADVGQIETVASPVVGTAVRRFVDVILNKHDEVVVQVSNAGAASSTFVAYMKVKYGGQSAAEAEDVDSE